MEFIKGKIDTADASVEFYRAESHDAPVLVLLPGSFNDHRLWARVSEYFTKPFDIVIFNLQGHAGSTPKMPHSTIRNYSEIIISALDTLGIERFFVSGNSIGGMMALEIARLAPARVRGAIPCEGWTHHSVQQTAFGGAKNETLSAEGRLSGKTMRDEVTSGWTREEMTAFSNIWKNFNCYDFLCETDVPVLSLWGDRGVRPPDARSLMIPRRDNIEIKFLHGAPHSFLWDYGRQTAQFISNFSDGK